MDFSRLRAENLRLKRENEILKKRRRASQGMFCEIRPAGSPQGDAWIAEQGKRFALAEMCGVLDVSISGYRAWARGGKPDP